jgi:hypothetical protein
MSLRKNPVTPARLEANRRNSQKSTGPRTARGKSQSRLNRLRGGGRSRLYGDLLQALMDAPPCRVLETAQAVLTPAQMSHPLFANLVETFCQAEAGVVPRFRSLPPPKDA